MKKYLVAFKVSLSNEFVYRFNFVLWRVRKALQLLMTYFLWSGVFVGSQVVFGYTQSQILTYVFMVLIVQTWVMSAPSSDSIGGEIGNGDLSNYLVKPLGYLKYWFTRDLASKLLNMVFAFFEISILWILFRPTIVIPTDLILIFGFLISCGLAIGIYYLVSVCSRFLAFWAPENTWGLAFLILVFMETLGGLIFPLNILPTPAYIALQFTPFPYLVYFPIAIFSGKIVGIELFRILTQSFIWLLVMLIFTKFLWKRGMMVYQASGK